MTPRAWARTAGAIYLAVIVLGAFAIGFAPTPEANEPLYRLSLAAHAAVLALDVFLAAIFYYLFLPVSRIGALLVVLFSVLAAAVEGAGLANELGAYSASQVHAAYVIQQVIFAFYNIVAGFLVFRSGLWPRVIGVLLAVGGLSYLLYSFGDILSPSFAVHLVPWVQLPSGVGEISFCLVLLIAGVNVRRWNELRELTGAPDLL